ncbi:hypothetical protein FBU59_000518 [Linderina macrospora]|uniref:Uncharacterized protein n=1 Tax=Linderina macrospora TaxID=4868 RepID=A0ACC1JGK5_9FUNG|nr:hypothetical protein FBU59_000518 [Linderina macrospora]
MDPVDPFPLFPIIHSPLPMDPIASAHMMANRQPAKVLDPKDYENLSYDQLYELIVKFRLSYFTRELNQQSLDEVNRRKEADYQRRIEHIKKNGPSKTDGSVEDQLAAAKRDYGRNHSMNDWSYTNNLEKSKIEIKAVFNELLMVADQLPEKLLKIIPGEYSAMVRDYVANKGKEGYEFKFPEEDEVEEKPVDVRQNIWRQFAL